MKCPVCDGEGEFTDYIDYQIANRYDCNYCMSKGKVSTFKWLRYHLWQLAPEWLFDFYVWLIFPRESER